MSYVYHSSQTFSGVDVSMATECLLTAIYGECTSNRGNSISQHVAMATGLDKARKMYDALEPQSLILTPENVSQCTWEGTRCPIY